MAVRRHRYGKQWPEMILEATPLSELQSLGSTFENDYHLPLKTSNYKSTEESLRSNSPTSEHSCLGDLKLFGGH